MLRIYPGDIVRIKTGKNAGRIGTAMDFENGALDQTSRLCVLIWNSGKRKFLYLKPENVEFVRRHEPPEET